MHDSEPMGASSERGAAPAGAAAYAFTAPKWARGAHAQTVAGFLLRSTDRVARRRERIATPDHDFLDLDWFAVDGSPDPRDPARPLVLALHGLEGCTASTYFHVLARELAARGVSCVGLNFRGCSGEMNRTRRLYHAGEWTDPLFVLALLAARAPGRKLACAGFSLGGNVLLRWLGEAGVAARQRVVAAAAVSVPFDLAAGSRHTDRGPGRFYAQRLLKEMRFKVERKTTLLQGHVDLARARKAATLWEFDEAVTAPLHGFADAADYYAAASSAPWLPQVRVPTLVVHALDDPFLPASAVPRDALQQNPFLVGAVSERGGHMGFVAGAPWSPRFTAEARVAAFLASWLRD